ncbi:unnamed protein product [Linum tenue]|uniref:C2 tensin-type domain-containing protein n=1 Tax=Linum tenue TaxID=586396 RepID=A0AAV0QES7_9ROSI|nr:unnamed protein product [Linum tenue]
MALCRRLFHRNPPDGLLEISDRVFVFNSCLSTNVMKNDEYKLYLNNIVAQLHDQFPDASYTVFNFHERDQRLSQLSDILTQHDDVMVLDYPRQYAGCPLLPLKKIRHFLRFSESWLSMEQQSVLLMHCERGGWHVLAFMLAGFLLHRGQYTGELKTLEAIYKLAPNELLCVFPGLNSLPSHLRYLRYVSRRNFVGGYWTPSASSSLDLDCLVLRALPVCERGEGCRTVVRVYGKDPSKPGNGMCKLLCSSWKTERLVRQYAQEECVFVKVDLRCRVQGDIVIECVYLDEELLNEQMIFRVMFHTGFVRENILILKRDDVDILSDARDRFPREFKAVVLFANANTVPPPLTSGDDLNESGSARHEEFHEVEENFAEDALE